MLLKIVHLKLLKEFFWNKASSVASHFLGSLNLLWVVYRYYLFWRLLMSDSGGHRPPFLLKLLRKVDRSVQDFGEVLAPLSIHQSRVVVFVTNLVHSQ
jgi:hypothetical protein